MKEYKTVQEQTTLFILVLALLLKNDDFEKHRGGVPKSTLLPEHTLLTENRKHSRINPSTAYLSPLPNENHAAMLPYNQEAAPLNCLLFLARSHKLVKVQKSGLLPLQSDLDV